MCRMTIEPLDDALVGLTWGLALVVTGSCSVAGADGVGERSCFMRSDPGFDSVPDMDR